MEVFLENAGGEAVANSRNRIQMSWLDVLGLWRKFDLFPASVYAALRAGG